MKVLIATDGSDYSKNAVDEACRSVLRSGESEVLVVSAYEEAYPMAAEPFAISAEYYQKLEEAVRDMASNHVNEAKATILGRFPDGSIVVSTEILAGTPAQQIVERAKDWDADLIVVGSHGRGFWGRMLGSVSDGVVHHAPCSVLVVRPRSM
ncbi:MAG: universal stress protein [Acidobacteria bacterium]|nr:universal stress protein [Acidobacteriota bacterium]MCW5947951.1 universal stress protein [Pyrinomonadaceae bacterium]